MNFVNTSQVSQLLMERAQELASHVVTCVWERIPDYDADHMPRQDFDDYVMPNLLSALAAVKDGTPADVHLQQDDRWLKVEIPQELADKLADKAGWVARAASQLAQMLRDDMPGVQVVSVRDENTLRIAGRSGRV